MPVDHDKERTAEERHWLCRQVAMMVAGVLMEVAKVTEVVAMMVARVVIIVMVAKMLLG